MKLNVNQLRRIIAEEVSVLRESDRELFFDKLVPEEEADRIFSALPPSFDDREYARTMGGRGRIPKGMDRVQITADPGKRVAKMLAAYQDYDAGKLPSKRKPGATPMPEPKNSDVFEGLKAEYPRLLAFVLRSKDRNAFLEQLADAEGNARFNGEGIDGLEMLADYANDLL